MEEWKTAIKFFSWIKKAPLKFEWIAGWFHDRITCDAERSTIIVPCVTVCGFHRKSRDDVDFWIMIFIFGLSVPITSARWACDRAGKHAAMKFGAHISKNYSCLHGKTLTNIRIRRKTQCVNKEKYRIFSHFIAAVENSYNFHRYFLWLMRRHAKNDDERNDQQQ